MQADREARADDGAMSVFSSPARRASAKRPRRTAAVRAFSGARIRELIGAIADDPDRPYWDSWAIALEDLVTSTGLLATGAVDERIGG